MPGRPFSSLWGMSKSIDILVVDDNEDDLNLTLMALRKLGLSGEIAVCRDGQEALDFLFGTGPFAGKDISLPKLILLDIKLPKVDGFEVLKKVKTDERTKNLLVVMLSSSSRKSDLTSSYSAGANSYLVKSVDFRQFTEDIAQLGRYWLGLNRT